MGEWRSMSNTRGPLVWVQQIWSQGGRFRRNVPLGLVIRRKGLRKRGKCDARALPCSPPDKAQGRGKDPKWASNMGDRGQHKRSHRVIPILARISRATGTDWWHFRTEYCHLINKWNAQNSKVKSEFTKAQCDNMAWRGKSFCQMFMQHQI